MVWASKCTTLDYITDPALAEAIASRRGVEFCTEMGFRSITMEGHAMEIVLALKKEDGHSSKYSCILKDARFKLSNFHSWGISFVHREANAATHELAHLAVTQHLHHVWIDTYPISLSATVRKDQCNLMKL
jgi:hypothetical protein